MMYTYKIEQAIRAATILHQGNTRKGRAAYPTVSHVFAVACIVADYTEDEDIIAAALLHDILESTDYTPSELRMDFGDRIANIVEVLTRPPHTTDEDSAQEARSQFLHTLRTAPDDIILIATADLIHNMRSVVEEYEGNTKDYLRDFGGATTPRTTYYVALYELLNSRLKSDIIHEFNHVYQSFKGFLETDDHSA